MKLSCFKWYRTLIGGTWELYFWSVPWKRKRQREWRRVRNRYENNE